MALQSSPGSQIELEGSTPLSLLMHPRWLPVAEERGAMVRSCVSSLREGRIQP